MQKVPAYLLHSRKYRESSLIISLLMQDSGRISAVAKGALSSKKNRSLFEPFRPVSVSLNGSGSLKYLTQIEPQASQLFLNGNQIACGFYLNELIYRLTAEGDCNSGLFDLYQRTLVALARGETETALRRFEMEFLQIIGYGIHNSVENLDSAGQYYYDVESGISEHKSTGAIAVSGKCMLALCLGDIGEDVKREAKIFLRRIIGKHLNGRPLKSREMFRSKRNS